MKAFSDLEQSKKLAEILPLESADMYYSHEFVNSAGDYYKLNIASEGYFDDKELLGSDIPCWSLAALLGALPKNINIGRPSLESNYKGYYWIQYYDECMKPNSHNTGCFDNPVDACYEMIIHLHELKML